MIMNQSVKLSKAISYVVIACAILLLLAVWPMGFFHQTYVSKSNELMAMESDPVNVECNVTQMFVAEGGELSAVDLYVCNDMRGETITFRLYDASYSELFNTFHVVKNNQEVPGFVHIPVGYDLIKDQEYYFTLEGLSADMTVAYEERETSTSIVNGFMSYAGIELPRYNVIIRYEYSSPLVWWQILLIWAGAAAITAGILWLVRYVFDKKLIDRDIKVHTVFKVVLTPPIVLTGLILCLMVFPGRKFGTGALNYAFYGGSILLLTAVCLWIVYYKREGMEPLIKKEVLIEKIPEWLQAVCIAGVLWSCYEYMNGLYDIHHEIATRKMLVWFMLGLICTFSKKELFRIWTWIWLAGAGIGSYAYAKPYLGMEEDGELYKLQAYIIVAGGLAILLTVIKWVRIFMKKDSLTRKLSIPYTGFLAVLMGFLIAYRNQRDWVLVMVVIFVIFYLRMWSWEKSDRITDIFGNGLIFNFIYMVGYSLLHRPYHKYIYHRYGLGFHTVTMTGVYLALILCAVFARFLVRYHQKRNLKLLWSDLLLIGVANVYLFITLSRTGYLAAAVTEIVMILLFVVIDGKERWKTMLNCFGSVLAVSILFFPIVFTMTRILPAVSNDPVLSDVEKTGVHISKGTPTDSDWYMDLKKFMEKAGYKVFGKEEEEQAMLSDKEERMEDTFYPALVRELKYAFCPEAVYIVNDSILLADADEEIPPEGLNDVTNGRVDIFKAYIAHWNMTGHEEMYIEDENGAMIVHAHNVFLQVIHDHGLVTGILFILFGVVSFVMSVYRFIKKKDLKMALTIAVILAFAASGMAEWNFHLCNPFGPTLFAVITPLLFKCRDMENNGQE